MASQTCSKINRDYLPIKAHYFFLYGGCGGTVPFMQVVAKEFGISPMAVGIIFTFVPLSIWISKPLFGFITDKVQKTKNVVLILIIVTALTFLGVLFIPSIKNEEVRNINITTACQDHVWDGLEVHFSNYRYESPCDKNRMKGYKCTLISQNCLQNSTLNGILNATNNAQNNNSITEFFLRLHKKNISEENCDCLKTNLSSLFCELDFYKCFSFGTELSLEYNTYNFWIFVFLTVISGAGAGTLWSLTDAACNAILGDNSNKYGKQRLWGTISWGITTFAAGFFNDLASGNSKNFDYSPGFYLMLIFFAIDVVILYFIRIEKAHCSINICKDIRKVFSSLKTVNYAFGVYICGTLSGILWTYQFWFLTDLGSTPLLLGLVAAIQCLVVEVPFFFFSGWFIKKIGYFYCLIIALAAFSLRMGLYSLLNRGTVMCVIPIELLHGLTYAVFFATMTLYAVEYASPGTEATMIGIFGGIFEGLGVATGSFLGGVGFNTKGGHWTFFVASMITLCCIPMLVLFNVFLSRNEGLLKFDKKKTVSMKEIVKCTSQETIK